VARDGLSILAMKIVVGLKTSLGMNNAEWL
jgi:hypothetical protein